MNRYLKALFVVVIFSTSLYLKSQTTEYNLPPNSVYKRAKISLNDFTKVEGKDVEISNCCVTFINIASLQKESISLDSINYLRVREGNKAGMWAAYGALFMGLVSAMSFYDHPMVDNPGELTIGFTFSGALIGALIGTGSYKWKTYYLN